uniref:Uncharacterized protein n=1 Tax=Oryza glumipatula TaxID=40148 RepID=A0A0E0B9R1_9ORYZ
MRAHAVHILPGIHAPKRSPIAFTVGDGLYVMEAASPEPLPMCWAEHCFEALIHCLPPAPPTSRTGTGAPSQRCTTPETTGPPHRRARGGR